MNILKPLSNTIYLGTTGNTVSNATLVYISSHTQHAIITLANSSGANQSSIFLTNPNYILVEKKPSDLLSANSSSDVYATKIAYRG